MLWSPKKGRRMEKNNVSTGVKVKNRARRARIIQFNCALLSSSVWLEDDVLPNWNWDLQAFTSGDGFFFRLFFFGWEMCCT